MIPMNYIIFGKKYYVAPPIDLSINTGVGGVYENINTDLLLAARLNISVGNISNFLVVGSDIKCKITGSYSIPANAFSSYPALSFYRDNDNLVTSIGAQSFNGCINLAEKLVFNSVTSITSDAFTNCNKLTEIILPICTSIGSVCFRNNYCLQTIYAPLCTNFGGTSGNDIVFNMPMAGCIIYAHPSLETNNGGGVDGDLAYAITQGATVRYVSSFVAPSPVTDLSASTVYNTSIQLNFTVPSSANDIDYYECYANGVFKNKIYTSGGFINDLSQNTNYSITIYAVDIFMNKSIVSNFISQTTLNTGILSLQEKTVVVFPLSNGVEIKKRYGTKVGSSVTFVTGVNGNAANFNGSSNSFIAVQDSNDFSFTNGTNDLPFSVNFKLKLTSSGTQFLIAKTSGGFATNNAEWCVYNSSGSIIVLFSNKTTGYIANQFASALTTGVWYDITMTYSGSGTNSGIKLYVDNVSKTYTTLNSGTYTSMGNTNSVVTIGQEKLGAGAYPLNGIIDEATIFKTELTLAEVTYLQTNNYPF